MDLEGISSSWWSVFTLYSKVLRWLPQNHFSVIKVVNTIGALLFLSLGVCLIVATQLTSGVAEELRMAANLDQTSPIIFAAAIVAIMATGICTFGAWKVRCWLSSGLTLTTGDGAGQREESCGGGNSLPAWPLSSTHGFLHHPGAEPRHLPPLPHLYLRVRP